MEGIKIFVNECIPFNILTEFIFINELYECLTCQLTISNIKYIVNCIYRPPHTNVIRFIDKFQDHVLSRFSNRSNIIICGDFNINLLNPHSLNSVNTFISSMSAFNFISVINSPSKYNPNNPITKYSLIDQIWVNFTHLNISSGVICDDISDHFPIFMHFKFTSKNSHKITRYRIFNDNNINKFNSLDFTECFTSNSADVAYNIFHKLLYKSYNNSFPLKTKRIKSDNFSEWITPELKFCLKKKYRLLNMLKSSQITERSYTEYKNLLNNAIRQAKTIFYMKKASNIDAKKTWKFIYLIRTKKMWYIVSIIIVVYLSQE